MAGNIRAIPSGSSEDPNERTLSDINLGTWQSVSDVDEFFSRFNHDNGYKDGDTSLAVGNRITIQDGTYNSEWIIAGFDMEYKHRADDGTIYRNGYGISMIPKNVITYDKYHDFSIQASAPCYYQSRMYNIILPSINSKIIDILGDHMILRNALIDNKSDGSYAKSYIWTSVYSTLMSVGQLTGLFGRNYNGFNDGEATYKLPIFDQTSYYSGYQYWTRNGYDWSNAYYVNSNNFITYNGKGSQYGVRPLIYLR